LAIDGVEHTLDGETLIIADAGDPVAIAGVIGESSRRSPLHKKYSFGVRIFRPALVRQRSKKYKISTSPVTVFGAFGGPCERRARFFATAQLIREWVPVEDTSGLMYKDHSPKAKKKPVLLRVERAKRSGPFDTAARSADLKALSFRCKTPGRGNEVARELPP